MDSKATMVGYTQLHIQFVGMDWKMRKIVLQQSLAVMNLGTYAWPLWEVIWKPNNWQIHV